MAAMNLELGPPEASPELLQTFAAKLPNSSPANRIAILVAHGMGSKCLTKQLTEWRKLPPAASEMAGELLANP